MNTCGLPISPKLYKLTILNGLKQILKRNGLLIISAINVSGPAKSLVKESYKSQFNHMLRYYNEKSQFYNYFEEIETTDERIVIQYKLKSDEDLERNLSDTILLKRELLDELQKIDQTIDQTNKDSNKIHTLIITLYEYIRIKEEHLDEINNENLLKNIIEEIEEKELLINQYESEYDNNIEKYDKLLEERSLKIELLYDYEKKIFNLESQIRRLKVRNENPYRISNGQERKLKEKFKTSEKELNKKSSERFENIIRKFREKNK